MIFKSLKQQDLLEEKFIAVSLRYIDQFKESSKPKTIEKKEQKALTFINPIRLLEGRKIDARKMTQITNSQTNASEIRNCSGGT